MSIKNRLGGIEPLLIPSKYTAYYIGLLSADGHISNRKELIIEVTDRELIYPLAELIVCNVREIIKPNANHKTSYRISKMHTSLMEEFSAFSGIAIGAKSKIPYVIPEWIRNNTEFLYYYITGIFNGDGSMMHYPIDESKGIERSRAEACIEQHISQLDNLSFLANILDWNITITSKNTCRIRCGNKEGLNKFYRLYNNDKALSRKLNKLKEYLECQ